MTALFHCAKTWVIVTALVCLSISASAAEQPVDQTVASLGGGFRSEFASVNGTKIHYVRGGSGPAVILVHGFPQDWFAFHEIMPRLAQRFTVVAPDMRGIGRSAPISEDYDAATVAEDIRQLAIQLDLNPVFVVGQDNGGMVAYAFARLYPDETRGAMILDVPLPGLEPWEAVKAEHALWHFAFHQTPDLPEALIEGREFIYFRAFFDRFAYNPNAISDEDVAHYVSAYEKREQLQAGLAFYRRAYPSSEIANAEARDTNCPPIILAGGEYAAGPANDHTAADLEAHGCANVFVETISDSGHWVVNEQPDAVAELIERYGVP